METLTIKEVEVLAFKLAQAMLAFNEPIPDFSTRYPNVLESCLAVPFQKFSGSDLYKGLLAKAGILFYLLIKNHPFQNGNKRIALTTTLLFFVKNKKWLKLNALEFYKFTMWVAESPAKLKTETVRAVEKFFKTYLVPL